MLKGAALGIAAYFIGINLWALIIFAPQFYRLSDFRQFYAAGYLVRSGNAKQLYNFDLQIKEENKIAQAPDEYQLPFVSPAYHAMLFAPISRLPYRTAYALFLGLNLAIVSVIGMLLWPYMQNLKAVHPLIAMGLIAGFLPFGVALLMGQDSLLLTLAIMLSFLLLERDRELHAGMLLALALFKFQIITPIILVFLLCKRWKLIAGFVPVACGLAIISLSIAGISQTKVYIASLFSIASMSPGAGLAHHPVKWGMMPNVAGLLFGILGNAPKLVIEVIAITVIAGLTAVTVKLCRHFYPSEILLVAIPFSVLAGYHTYMHDLSPLILPTAVVLDKSLGRNTAVSLGASSLFLATIGVSYFPNHLFWCSLPVTFLGIAATLQIRNSLQSQHFGSASVGKIAAPSNADSAHLGQLAMPLLSRLHTLQR